VPGPIEIDGKLYCPVCRDEVVENVVRYYKITDGVFKSKKIVTEITYECKKCGWSYWTKDE